MSEWKLRTVAELFDVELGKMLSPASSLGQQWPYLANRNVQWGRLVLNDLGTMHFSYAERRRYELRPGDVLVCEGGEIGRTAVWNGAIKDCYFQNAIHRLRPKAGADSRFMRHFMEHASRKGRLRPLAGQTSIAHLPKERLVGWRVEFPPIEEQWRIAEILDTLDETIAASERLVAKLNNHALAVERRIFEGLSALGQQRLDQVANVDRGRFTARPRNDPSFYGGLHPFAQTGDVSAAERGPLTSASQTLNDRGARVSRPFQAGTIAVTIAANIADTAILTTETFFPDSVVGVTPHDPAVVRWIEMCIHRAKPKLEARAPQSAQRNINLQDLRPLPLPLVGRDEQLRGGAIYEQEQATIAAERARLAKLRALRAGLADDLLTGRVRTVPE